MSVIFICSGGLDAYQRTFGRDDSFISGSGKMSAARTSVSGRTVMRALGLKVRIALYFFAKDFFNSHFFAIFLCLFYQPHFIATAPKSKTILTCKTHFFLIYETIKLFDALDRGSSDGQRLKVGNASLLRHDGFCAGNLGRSRTWSSGGQKRRNRRRSFILCLQTG